MLKILSRVYYEKAPFRCVTIPKRFIHMNTRKLCEVRVRFAPSPTGNMHLGGLRTALFNYAFAKSQNGKFILRIEDTDQTRLVKGISDKLEDILSWAEICPDESPIKGGPYGPYTQSQRLQFYKESAEYLLENGKAYKCFCSDIRLKLLRKEQMKNKEKSMYDGNCRNLSQSKIKDLEQQNTPYTIRFKLENYPNFTDLVYGDQQYDQTSLEGDPILLKSDGFPTYNFANVVDDHYMNITHVLRGEELLISTPKHLLLYKAFNWKPPTYAHLPLLYGSDGNKLSKRHGASDIESFINTGYSSEAILNLISYSGGAFKRQNFEFNSFTLQDLITRFDISSMKTNKAIIDMKHLPIFSRNHLLKRLSNPMEVEELLKECRDVLGCHYSQESLKDITDEYIINILKWDELQIEHPKDLVSSKYSYLWQDKSEPIKAKAHLEAVKEIITILETESKESPTILTAIGMIQEKYKLSKKKIFNLLRLIITNSESGPPVKDIIELLGRKRIITKLKLSIQ